MLVSLTTYLPTYMSDVRSGTLWLAASSLTILEAAGVVGALVTGTISDRIGRSTVLLILLGSSPLIMLAFLLGPEWLAIPLLLALGLTAISPTPVILAVVQDQFPDNRALANGVFLALSFMIRALGTWTVGAAADAFGLADAYLWSAVIGILAVPAVLRLARVMSN
jgi:FSR family fosmidomycin resistance protein-like MFS transporter